MRATQATSVSPGPSKGREINPQNYRIVILGLSITSSWGNGHATTYRGLVRELALRGHNVVFLERDVPWYASQRDIAPSGLGRVELYSSIMDLQNRFSHEVRQADFVMMGSYVPEGVSVGQWVLKTAQGPVAFYDIDTPITMAKLRKNDHEYISRDLIPRFDLYLSFAGGPVLDQLRTEFGARKVSPFYCCIDPGIYHPSRKPPLYDLGYMGTYSKDRQQRLEEFLLQPARAWTEGRFAVAGPLYPADIDWPPNVRRVEHLAPAEHKAFYCAQRFTLNLTRADMIRAGFSPSTRIFEASACATPVITDPWDGLPTFLEPGREILVAHSRKDVMTFLNEMTEEERICIGRNARQRVMAAHTSGKRALELENLIAAVRG